MTVREVAIALPQATRVFEKLKIDYCCGGHQSLDEACSKAGLEIEQVVRLLEQGEPTPTKSDQIASQSMPLAELADYIVAKHHVFTRDELERLTALLEKVCSVHGMNHPELSLIQSEFQNLRADLEPHMLKEERILFPYITRLEAAATTGAAIPFAPFGSVHNPIAAMMREHDAAGDILKKIRQLSKDFALPEDACFSYRTLYNALQELEADLHQHIHLENNFLFPRAEEIENQAQPAIK
jgi:regulator of cell morphogenesis and NO signaling